VTDEAEDLTEPEGTGSVPRRPTSLRSALDEPGVQAPRRPASSPPSEATAAARDAPSADPAGSTEPGGSPFDPVFERLATAQDRAVAFAKERPEVAIGGAFAGGLILATILKRLGRR
jgi:hypothetical protein